MDEILQQLNRVRGVGGSMLLSGDGLAMASALRQGVDENALAAAAGQVLDQGGRLAAALALGNVITLNAGGEQGAFLLLAAGPAFLVVLADPSANLALLQLEARPFVERIAKRLTL